MTEDGAVFGGQNNLFEGLENAYALYKPKMMPIFTTCSAPRSAAVKAMRLSSFTTSH